MDFSDLVSSFATGTYAVARRAVPAPPYTRGRANDPIVTPLTITAAVFPVSGDELDRLPEGQDSSSFRTVFTTTPLVIAEAGGTHYTDRITIDGTEWEVQRVEPWQQAGGGAYYRCLVQEVSENA